MEDRRRRIRSRAHQFCHVLCGELKRAAVHAIRVCQTTFTHSPSLSPLAVMHRHAILSTVMRAHSNPQLPLSLP